MICQLSAKGVVPKADPPLAEISLWLKLRAENISKNLCTTAFSELYPPRYNYQHGSEIKNGTHRHRRPRTGDRDRNTRVVLTVYASGK